MPDFTLKTYQKLMQSVVDAPILTFESFIQNPHQYGIILRHDVDRRPEYALAMAQLEAEYGIRGTYYFRIVPESFQPHIIRQIAELGHEIGYHYEDVDWVVRSRKYGVSRKQVLSDKVSSRKKVSSVKERVVGSRKYGESRKTVLSRNKVSSFKETEKFEKELADRGIESFERNLAKMREVADIRTICMHGSPLSKWDNRLLWDYYDYRELGLLGEPYFDIDWSEVFYLTDTGRSWDNRTVSVRDKVFSETVGSKKYGKSRKKVSSVKERVGREKYEESRRKVSSVKEKVGSKEYVVGSGNKNLRFRRTGDIVQAIEDGWFPDKAMMTVHPQRWTNSVLPWIKELFLQNIKNVVKRALVRRKF
ncbi:MAG: hypothetical protein U5R06_03960 [candidate division KSB1 bacterium]|nr:hypothetical protein [candidate division KSB1 bacterium]